MSPTPIHLLAVLGPLVGVFVVFVCWMVPREERRHPPEIVVKISVDISAFTEGMQRLVEAIRAVGVSLEQATANLRANMERHPELWRTVFASGLGDGDPVPQIGDEELAEWRDFLADTKRRSSRIVNR